MAIENNRMGDALALEFLGNITGAMEREREDRAFTQAQIAELCELSISDYRGLLAGSTDITLKAVETISKKLNISFWTLMTGAPTSS